MHSLHAPLAAAAHPRPITRARLPQLHEARQAHPEFRASVGKSLDRIIAGHRARHDDVIARLAALPKDHPERGSKVDRFVQKDVLVIESLAHAREMARLGNHAEARDSIANARQRLEGADESSADIAAMHDIIDHVEFYIDFAYGQNP